jgi:hypothetical protein
LLSIFLCAPAASINPEFLTETQEDIAMGDAVTLQTLRSENLLFAATGGISQNNRSRDLQPGFYDSASGQMAVSCFADGMPAPIHLLDGVPREWVTERNEAGRVLSVKGAVVSGFIRDGRFFTRAEAAALVDCTCATV